MLKLLKTKILFFCTICFIPIAVIGQNPYDDYELLNSKQSSIGFSEYVPQFWLVDSDKKIVKYNPVNIALSTLLFSYQKIISPQIASNCLFNPSCSKFGKQLIQEFGIKGVFLTADRLTRCSKMASYGISPLKVDYHDHKVHETVEMFKMTNDGDKH